jgi:hypothetical protein
MSPDHTSAGNPSNNDQKLLEAMLNFIKRGQSGLDKHTLGDFLDNDPPRESAESIVPLDELTERLELIAKIDDEIQNVKEDFELKSYGFAALLIAPLAFLRSAANETGFIGTVLGQTIRRGLDAIPNLVKLCMFIQPFPKLV